MKRSAAIVVGLLILAAAAAFVPALKCPDCLGVAAEGVFAPGCPRCGDGGRVSGFNRVSRRSLDPDLAILVSEPWHSLRTDDEGFTDALQRLLERSGQEQLEVGRKCVGELVFTEEGRVVGLFRSPVAFAGRTPVVIVLFERGGEILDRVAVEDDSGPLDVPAVLARGGQVTLRSEAPQPSGRFAVYRGRDWSQLAGSVLKLRPRGGRLEVAAEP